MTTSAETKMGRLMFRRKMRLEMIDQNEREIERRKSYNRNLKEQISQINFQIRAEQDRAMASVSRAIPMAA